MKDKFTNICESVVDFFAAALLFVAAYAIIKVFLGFTSIGATIALGILGLFVGAGFLFFAFLGITALIRLYRPSFWEF